MAIYIHLERFPDNPVACKVEFSTSRFKSSLANPYSLFKEEHIVKSAISPSPANAFPYFLNDYPQITLLASNTDFTEISPLIPFKAQALE